jgi:hypothetical protein
MRHGNDMVYRRPKSVALRLRALHEAGRGMDDPKKYQEQTKSLSQKLRVRHNI